MKSGYFHFDSQDPIYRDHFPGHPVVPGSLIIHAFREAIGRFAGGGMPRITTRFRFKRFITPGRYAFRIQPRSDGRMACLLLDKDETVVTGTL